MEVNMCVRPMNVKGNVVPCGKCFECKTADRVGWSLRVQHEIKNGSFVTLTYNNENNPGRVIKKELQDYIKRVREEVRKKDGNFRVVYFGVGEYGDRFNRPHYHIIININDRGILESKWKKGIVHIGEVTDASIHYCTKYVQKNSGWKKDQKPKEIREFRIMSKSIGQAWLKLHAHQYRSERITYITHNSIKYSLPRYYRNKIFGMIVKETVDKETGVITKEIIREKLDISDIQLENVKKKLEKLIKLYADKLHGDIDNIYRKRMEKYSAMYNSLKILKNERTSIK